MAPFNGSRPSRELDALHQHGSPSRNLRIFGSLPGGVFSVPDIAIFRTIVNNILYILQFIIIFANIFIFDIYF